MLLQVAVAIAEQPHGAQEPKAKVEQDAKRKGEALGEVEVQRGDRQGEPGGR